MNLYYRHVGNSMGRKYMWQPIVQLKKLMYKHNNNVLLVNIKWEFQDCFIFKILMHYCQLLMTLHSKFGKELTLCSKINHNKCN